MPVKLKYMKGEEFAEKLLNGYRDFREIRLERDFDLNSWEGFEELNKYLMKQLNIPVIIEHTHTRFIENKLNFSYSDLRGLKAEGIYLPLSNWFMADLRGVNFVRGSFRYSMFSKANLEGAQLASPDENLTKRLNLEEFTNTVYPIPKFPKHMWGGGDYVGTNFNNANLKRSKLECAIVGDSSFMGADLRRASLKGSYFGQATFHKADLREADLSETEFCKAILIEAHLRKANLDRANFSSDTGDPIYIEKGGASLNKADLRGARYLWRTKNLDRAFLEKTIVTEKEKRIIEKLRGGLFDIRE